MPSKSKVKRNKEKEEKKKWPAQCKKKKKKKKKRQATSQKKKKKSVKKSNVGESEIVSGHFHLKAMPNFSLQFSLNFEEKTF